MEESSLLETTAEVSVAFAGFIGIFLVLAARDGRFPPTESFQIRLIVLCSIAPVFGGAVADDVPDAWAGQIESYLLQGFRLHEVVLLHRPSRTLIVPDLGFNIHRTSHTFARLFFKANGMWQHFGPSRLIRNLAVSNHAAFQASLDRLLDWDFERILPGHGDVIEYDGRTAVRAAWPK